MSDFAAVLELQPQLMAYAYRLTGNRADAEDLTQSTLLKAWRSYATFRAEHEGSTLGWLRRILYHIHVSPYSHPKSVRAVQMPDGLTHEAYPCAGEHAVSMAEVDRALSALAPQRLACFLMARAGYEYAEIARHRGCRIGTVKSRVNRVDAELFRLLEVA